MKDFPNFYKVLLFDKIHGTIIPTGITCKKIPCYMRDSARRWLLLKILKYFEVMLNIFEFPHMKKIL